MANQYLVDSPYSPFTIKNQFKAIYNGKVYIGEVDKDPLNPSQQIQVYVVNESGTNVPVSQPIALNAGGYLVYNGQVSKFVTLEPYSMVVLNSVDAEMWRVDDISKVDPDNITASNVRDTTNGGSVQDFIDAQYTTVAELATGKFTVSTYVRLTDRDFGLFRVQSGGVADGSGVLDAGDGNTAAAQKVRTFYASQHGLKSDIDIDNTSVALAMLAEAQLTNDYFEIDLQGGMFRVYAGAELSPLRLVGKKFKIKNGGFYAANASVSPTTVEFPSTITFDQCDYVAENFTCYAKGEKWGNTDASSGLDSNGRASWIAEKGGHAIAVVRSKYKHINVSGGLAGSVASIYFPSSRGVSYGGNAYCSSLGYSAYNADTWCGTPAEVGIGDFIHLTHGSSGEATEHKRPEDNSVVGTAIYCGKIGFLGEGSTGADVQVYITGGRWAGFYANGSSMDLGNAFAATSATVIAFNPVIGDAASIVRVGNSSNTLSVCKAINVEAKDIGLTGVMISNQSFGSCEAFLSGNVNITSNKTWAGSGVPELVNSSVVANRGVNITVNVEIDAIVTGNATRVAHNSRACYGGLKVSGGDYNMSQYIAYSKGWGGSAAGTRKGFVTQGKPIFRVPNTVATDELLHWQDADDSSVATYVYIDAESAAIISGAFRRVDFITQTNPARREKILLPRTLDNCYALEADRPREVIEAKAISSGGASGSNWAYKFAFPQGKPPLFPCMVALNDEIRLVLSGSGNPVVEAGELVQTVFIQGGVSGTAITVGKVYGFNGA